ncbi:MAG: ATP-binding cassette domain-containing protein [Rikenellaceae bacterium]
MKRIQLINTLPQVFAKSNQIVSDVWCKNLSFERGQHYLIEANSGVGKSSLCSFIYGNRTDYQGVIKFDDNEASSLNQKRWIELRNNELSMLFQDLKLFPELTAYENVKIKNRLTNFKKRAEIFALFEELGIEDKANKRVEHLSFGQQQRVAFIRSLCQPFDFIMLDEPISHLDKSNGAIVADILLREATQREASIITTSIGHHLPLPYNHTLKL